MKAIEALKTAKSDEQKIELLDKIVADLGKNDTVARFSSIVGKLVYAINALCAFVFGLYLACEGEEVAVLERILPISSDIVKFMGKWNTGTVSLVVFLIVFVLVIPVVCSLIVKLLLKICCKNGGRKNAEKDSAAPEQEGTEPSGEEKNGDNATGDTTLKDKSKDTYMFVLENGHSVQEKAKRSAPTSIAVALIAMAIFGTLISQLPESASHGVSLIIFGTLLCGSAVFLVSQILMLMIKFLLAYSGDSVSYSEQHYLEEFWLENDPEEREERRVAAELAEQRRQEEARREARKPKLTFHASGISSANTLTVYVDGVQAAKFDGGRDHTISLTPGNHTFQVVVYNDASESAYRLDPVSHYFKEYETYDIDYN